MNLKVKLTLLNILLLAIFFIGLIYILLPGPRSIDDFSPLPNSTKSQLTGDTVQNPNIAAYFSEFRRDFITKYYKDILSSKLIPGLKILPIRLNHPPEEAYRYVRDQQESTFLEEYVFPLRESLFINGYDPSVENMMHHNLTDFIGDHLYYGNVYFNTKTTLRFHPSLVLARVFVYFGIWVSFIFLFILAKKAAKS